MKKTLRIILPIFLALCIILCTCWYLFVYDRAFTRDVLLSFARYNDEKGNHKVATWFYNQAYAQSGDNDAVAVELAQQYKSNGNYTKAEYTLSKAIADGGGVDLYIALCKTYVEQDKLLDAVTMLDNITNPEIKSKLNLLRPAAPTCAPAPGFYNQYISVAIEANGGELFASNHGRYPSVKDTPYSEPITLVDGENTIYALVIADNGLVSPLSIFGYTVGGVIAKMEFADPVMETEIRKLLNVSEDAELYTNDLWTLKDFTVPAGVKDFGDIKHMSFLESLTIEKAVSGQLRNLAGLANLTKLTVRSTVVSQDELAVIATLPKLHDLTLSSCSIPNITPLQKAVGLVSLDLSGNGSIRNLDPLRDLVSLQSLSLKGNAVNNLTAISGLSNLTQLDISSNAVTSLASISALTRLTTLDASSNTISNLGDIKNLKALTTLNLSANKLTSVNALAECTTLKELNVSTNALTDIAKLKALVNLENLDFSFNQIQAIPAFPKDCQLAVINGSNNKITSVEPLSGLHNLNFVNLDYNSKLSSIKALASCHTLIEVNVYGTKVSSVGSLTKNGIVVNFDPT